MLVAIFFVRLYARTLADHGSRPTYSAKIHLTS